MDQTWPAPPCPAGHPSPRPTPRWWRSAPTIDAKPPSPVSQDTGSERGLQPQKFARKFINRYLQLFLNLANIFHKIWNIFKSLLYESMCRLTEPGPKLSWTVFQSIVRFQKIPLMEKHYFHQQILVRLSTMRNGFTITVFITRVHLKMRGNVAQ